MYKSHVKHCNCKINKKKNKKFRYLNKKSTHEVQNAYIQTV